MERINGAASRHSREPQVVIKTGDDLRWVRVQSHLMSKSESNIEDVLTSWLESFPSNAVKERINQIQDDLKDMIAELNFLQARMHEWETFRASPRTVAHYEKAAEVVAEGDGYPNKRWAASQILREQPTKIFQLSELREALIDREWLASDEKAAHALQMTLSNMVKRGEAERPEKGKYRHPFPADFRPLTLEELAERHQERNGTEQPLSGASSQEGGRKLPSGP